MPGITIVVSKVQVSEVAIGFELMLVNGVT